MRKVNGLLIIIVICMFISVPTKAAYCKRIDVYKEGDGFDWKYIKAIVDLNGDMKKDTIVLDENYRILINSKEVLKVPMYTDVKVVDLFKDKYVEICVKIASVIYVYRYDGKKIDLYSKFNSCAETNYKGIIGKKILTSLPNLPGPRDKNGRIEDEVGIVIPGSDQGELGNKTYIYAKYKINKKNVRMVEQEYPILFLTKTKATKTWIAYKNASLDHSNNKVATIKKGTKCIAERIKITEKYTFIRFLFNKGIRGWVIFPTSQIKFIN